MSKHTADTEQQATEKVSIVQDAYNMLYLCRCMIHDRTPSAELVSGMDMDRLWEICQYHSLTAMVAMALERVGMADHRFSDAKGKAIRKQIVMQAELAKLSAFMEANGIAHMPLKGAILKDLYPKPGMRQMADMDVLFDASHRDTVLQYMLASGYTAESVGKSNHDIYKKEPIAHFELHSALFGETASPQLQAYYANVWDRLLLEPGRRASYRFTEEDFYLYITAHEYKHFSNGGTGLRSLVDRAIYLRKTEDRLSFATIEQEAEKSGVAEYEREVRRLVHDVFDNFDEARAPDDLPITEEQREQLLFFLTAGTYGNIRILTDHQMNRYFSEEKKASKLRYVWRRVFPNMEFYRRYYPFYYRHKLLIPLAWGKRFFSVISGERRNRAMQELKSIRQYRGNSAPPSDEH